jgi:Protein of unknown function (DUF3443)
VRRFFFVALLGSLGLAAGCGGQSSLTTPVPVSLSPAGQSVVAGASVNISVNSPDYTGAAGVTWSMSGPGLLTDQGPGSVTFIAPYSVLANTNVVVTATLSPGNAGYLPLTVVPLNTIPNVQPVNVDGGPTKTYPNGGFTSVTICAPGTTSCRVIDGILVDTGSVGLRVLASALPSLPGVTGSDGNPVDECFQFVDHSYVWGQVVLADVRIAGEVAGPISIQSIADPSGFAIPSDCTISGAGTDDDNQQNLGANGILGVGLEPQDCGPACDPGAGGTPPGPAYYSCSSTCSAAFVPLTQQVAHPVVFFAADNNGVALQFPALSGAASTLSGSLTFGIGTQLNNGLAGATVFTVDSSGNLTTKLPGTGQSLTSSFIDSGSAGFFFPDSSIATCPDPDSSFFCPNSLTPITATNVGANGAQSITNFSVDNADQLFAGNPGDAAFSTLGGPSGAGTCSGGSGACTFDWGMPFFYGRTVYSAIRGQSVPLGIAAAPWWAYPTGFSGQ